MHLTAMSKRILVADDSDTVRRSVHSYLTRQDFDVCGEAILPAVTYSSLVTNFPR
jgi:hypothetical protein